MRIYENRDTKGFYSEEGLRNWFDVNYDDNAFLEEERIYLENHYGIVEIFYMTEAERDLLQNELYESVREDVFNNLEDYGIYAHELID